MPDSLGRDIYAYEISDRPGARLCIGCPPGRVRPALWIEAKGLPPAILAQFHGEKHALATINFLDAQIGQIQRVIDHLAGPKGDDDDKDETRPWD